MIRLVVSLLFSVLLAFTQAVAETPKIKIGGAFALTGNAAPFGIQELRGAELAVMEVNARGDLIMELAVEDTLSSGLGTVSAVKKLLEVEGADIIIGPTWLDSFQGALPIAQRHGALLITPSAGVSNFKRSSADYPRTFSTYFNFEREITALVEKAAAAGVRRIAILFDQDPYFQAMRIFAQKAAQRLEIEILLDQDFASGEQDFRTILRRLRTLKPDGVIFGSVDEGSVLSFLKQRQGLLPSLRVLGTHDLEGYVGNPNFAGLLKGVDYIVPADPSHTFKEAYRRRFRSDPLMSAPNSYDAVMLVAAARVAGAKEPAAIVEFLQTQQFQTVTFGQTRFSPLGGIENGEFILKLAR